MKNPLIINIRCTCIEEYVRMLDLHEQFRKQKSEGEILSIYVGATPAMYGKSPLIDKMLDKVFGDGCKLIPTMRIGEKPTSASDFVPPEKPLTLDEARAIGAGYAEQEEELAFDPNVEDYHPERGDSWKGLKVKPDITLEDVLVAQAEEPDPMEAIKTEAEGEPDGDEQDYNTTYAG